MLIKRTEKRELLERLASTEDWDGIAKEIKKIEKPSTLDCGNWALSRLGLPQSHESITLLHSLSGTQQPTPGIVVYRLCGAAKHFGIYAHGKVKSKWAHGPAYEHNIEEIPLQWGDSATFVPITPDLRTNFAMRAQGVDYTYIGGYQ